MKEKEQKSVYLIGISWREKGVVADHFRNLAHQLINRGHQVVFIVDQQRKDLENHISNPAFYTFPSKVPSKIRDLVFLYKLIRRYRPNCVIGVWRAVNAISLVGWITRVPHRIVWYKTTSNQSVFEIDKPTVIKRFLQVRRKRIIYRLASKIITSTQAMKKDLFNVYHVPENKIVIFPNSIKSPDSSLLILPKNPNKLVCVGRLCTLKGQETLLQAIVLLKDKFPDLHADFIGGGKVQEYLDQTRQLGIDHCCSFHGHLPHELVLENMAMAWITIVPSKDEAFGYVNIESMAVGTPVVASNVGGIPEIIRDGIDGILVPPNDPLSLACSIRKLLLDSALREKMGKSAREKFLMDYEQHNSIKSQADFFENLI